jgi:hypothetical protein
VIFNYHTSVNRGVNSSEINERVAHDRGKSRTEMQYLGPWAFRAVASMERCRNGPGSVADQMAADFLRAVVRTLQDLDQKHFLPGGPGKHDRELGAVHTYGAVRVATSGVDCPPIAYCPLQSVPFDILNFNIDNRAVEVARQLTLIASERWQALKPAPLVAVLGLGPDNADAKIEKVTPKSCKLAMISARKAHTEQAQLFNRTSALVIDSVLAMKDLEEIVDACRRWAQISKVYKSMPFLLFFVCHELNCTLQYCLDMGNFAIAAAIGFGLLTSPIQRIVNVRSASHFRCSCGSLANYDNSTLQRETTSVRWTQSAVSAIVNLDPSFPRY